LAPVRAGMGSPGEIERLQVSIATLKVRGVVH
jgi:hypothetical protein